VNDANALVVCVLPDTGERYLSKLYNDEWLRENQLLEPVRNAGDIIVRKDGDAPPLVSVGPHEQVRAALLLMNEHNISQLPVVEDAECVGSVSEATLMSRVIEDPSLVNRPVQAVMDAAFPVIDAQIGMAGVGRLLTRHNPAVIVRKNGVLTGIVTRYDMVRLLTE
jgi:cystathionine beta-synthase